MKIVVLTGGVGGAKLVWGLQQFSDVHDITAIVNTGDDFIHLGLPVSPDIDTLLYTLSDQADPQQGWGRAQETWNFMSSLASLGGPEWFRLGDGDLALHVSRLHGFQQGHSLSALTARFAECWPIRIAVVPMSDDPVRTKLDTDAGLLDFQDYFVARKCAPAVRKIFYQGADDAKPAAGALKALNAADAILIAPSNPWLSIGPILAIPGIRDALEQRTAPLVAVSPIIGGKAIKGPTVKLMHELGIEPSNIAILDFYAGRLDGLVMDSSDDTEGIPCAVSQTSTLMLTPEDRTRVAAMAIGLSERLIA